MGLIPFRGEDLRSATFHDNRFLNRPGLFEADIDEVLEYFPSQDRRPSDRSGRARYIFHIAFCGSTLLARALDSAGARFCYREPAC